MSLEADLALPPEFARAGFNRVMSGLDLTDALKEDIFDAWLPAVRSGNPRTERDALFVHLGHHRWRWRALEHAAENFAQSVWPRNWCGWIEKPFLWDEIGLETKLQLLIGSLAGASYAEQRFAQMSDPDVAAVYKITLVARWADCPIEANLLAIYGPAIEAGDYSTRPPFYPWCGVSLRPVSRRRTIQRGAGVNSQRLCDSRAAGCRACGPCQPSCRRCRSRGTPRRRSVASPTAGRCA